MSELPARPDARARLMSSLSMLEDPRDPRRRLHVLSEVLAVLCGCDNAEEWLEWGEKEDPWLQTFLSLPHGIPSQDTYLRVLARELVLAASGARCALGSGPGGSA